MCAWSSVRSLNVAAHWNRSKIAFVSRIRLLKALLLYLPRPCILWDARTRLNNACDPHAAVGAALKFSALDCNYATELNGVRHGFILCLGLHYKSISYSSCTLNSALLKRIDTVENASHHLFICRSTTLVEKSRKIKFWAQTGLSIHDRQAAVCTPEPPICRKKKIVIWWQMYN